MSFSYEDFYLSGFNTGVTISGIQQLTPLYWIVTGLKYNSDPITIEDYSWFTGIIIADSGTLTVQSGFMGYDSENDDYRGILTFDVVSGLTATGCIELYWNSGSVVQEGYALIGQFDTFSNKNKDAWDILTNEDGSVDNADDLHSHSAYAQNLGDLDDVRNVNYTTGNILVADGTDEYFSAPLNHNHLQNIGSIDHHNPSGYEAVSGSWIIASGDLDDYKYVSGRYVLTSGSYNSHIANASAHHVKYTLEQHNNTYHSTNYSAEGHIHDDRYYTETEINTNIYTKTQVDAHNWVEADITDLNKYTQAEVDAIIDRFDEQSITFPATPSEGDRHYDEDDDSEYRYNAEAEAWIEVGAGGGKSIGVDNLGNHTATQTLQLVDQIITSNDGDTTHIFGKAYIGYAGYSNYACFGYRDMNSAGNYGFMQFSNGRTYINASVGQEIDFRINNSDKMSVNTNGLQVGSDARITEFDSGTLANSNTKVPTSAAVYNVTKFSYKESNDLVHSNDTERTKTSVSYIKVKEIQSYIRGNIRIYWEHYKEADATIGQTVVYKNGVSVGTQQSATTSWTAETEDISVNVGDLIQIYGRAYHSIDPLIADAIYVRYMRIKYTDFINNDP